MVGGRLEQVLTVCPFLSDTSVCIMKRCYFDYMHVQYKKRDFLYT